MQFFIGSFLGMILVWCLKGVSYDVGLGYLGKTSEVQIGMYMAAVAFVTIVGINYKKVIAFSLWKNHFVQGFALMTVPRLGLYFLMGFTSLSWWYYGLWLLDLGILFGVLLYGLVQIVTISFWNSLVAQLPDLGKIKMLWQFFIQTMRNRLP